MALLKRLYETKTARLHKAYQKYVKKTKAAGKKPYTFKYWSREPVYFRGVTRRTPESKIAEADAAGRKPRKLYKRK
jgi:hypothetical protein